MRGFAVTAIIAVILVIFVMLFIIGISGNWKPVQGDVLGIMSFFTAVSVTFGEFISVTNLMMWTMIFFAVQGVFLYIYYKIARLLWVRVPEFQKWYEQTKAWIDKV
jgi:hypothetical protein